MGTVSEKLINNRAYELWQTAGQPIGRDNEFRLTAASELALPKHDEIAEADTQEEAGVLLV